jgi:hypothetical protein
VSDGMKKVEYWSFTMDYETDEIVINATVNGDRIQLRAIEKDIKSMQSWFELATHMKKHK